MDKIGQIPQGRRNGFDLASARPCRWNRHVRRPREADIFAISAPRACADQKLPLVISKPTPASAVEANRLGIAALQAGDNEAAARHFGAAIAADPHSGALQRNLRSEEHTSELQSLMRISYAVFCLK